MTPTSRTAIALFALLGLVAAAASAAPGDALFVQGDRVNVRAGPGRSQPVLMQLDEGRAVTERARRGDWVEVAIPGTAAGGGWIHRSLVGPAASPDALPAPPEDPQFELFEAAVRALNERARARTGAHAFARVESLGEGAVELVATEHWLGAPEAERRGDLATLLWLWDDAQDPEVPILVRILDPRGGLVMEKARP